MAIYRMSGLQKAVRKVLDRNMESAQLITDEDVDTLAQDDIIRVSIPRAARNVVLVAPADFLEHGHDIGDDIYWNADGKTGWILLPNDFLRLLVFEMSDWERPVYEPITPDDPLYAQQKSRWGGIRGNTEKPVCALCLRPEGKVLEFYSCKDDEAYMTRGVYIPYPKVDGAGGIDLPERCHDAVVYEAASLVAGILGDTTQAAVMRAESRRLLLLDNTTAPTTSTNQEQ